MFTEIFIHDFSRPLSERAKSRKYVGPYRWTPSEPGKGRGFYLASGGLRCGDGPIDLRLSWANDHLKYSRLSNTTGYYCDSEGAGDTLQPIVARLPNNRGFLAGWTMGEGMISKLEADIYADAESAAHAAHSIAEYDAEQSRELADDIDDIDD